MSVPNRDWPYWSVDIPGLSKAQAEELLSMAERSDIPKLGTVVDPTEFLTLHLDKVTVQSLVVALQEAQSKQHLLDATNGSTAEGILEVLQEWLKYAKREARLAAYD